MQLFDAVDGRRRTRAARHRRRHRPISPRLRRRKGVQLTWTDNSNVEDGYDVVVSTDCQEWSDYSISLPPNSTSYLDTSGAWCYGLVLNYHLQARKDGGWSDLSNPAY